MKGFHNKNPKTIRENENIENLKVRHRTLKNVKHKNPEIF